MQHQDHRLRPRPQLLQGLVVGDWPKQAWNWDLGLKEKKRPATLQETGLKPLMLVTWISSLRTAAAGDPSGGRAGATMGGRVLRERALVPGADPFTESSNLESLALTGLLTGSCYLQQRELPRSRTSWWHLESHGHQRDASRPPPHHSLNSTPTLTEQRSKLD